MPYFVYAASNQRFVLQCAETGGLVGLIFPGMPGETVHSFSHNFGPASFRKELVNVAEFPELDTLEFFTIESTSFYDLPRYIQEPNSTALRYFLLAEAKTIAYNDRREKPVPDPLLPLWHHTPPNPNGSWLVPAHALWVDDQGCWLGNRDGLVVSFNHQGEVTAQHKVPYQIRCIVGNDRQLYASSDDGHLYDLTAKLPYSVANIRDPAMPYGYRPIQAVALKQDCLLVLDVCGRLTGFDSDLKQQWQQNLDIQRGWFLEADEQFLYIGHRLGVDCYDRATQKLIWHQPTPAPVLSGDMTDEAVIVGLSNGEIYRLEKAGDLKAKQTEMQLLATCGGSVYTCVLTPDRQWLFTTDHQANLYGFAIGGTLPKASLQGQQWQQPLNEGAILNLKVWNDRLYATTTNGTLVCFHLSTILPIRNFSFGDATRTEFGIQNSVNSVGEASPQEKTRSHSVSELHPNSELNPELRSRSVSAGETPNSELIILQCIKKGSKLQVRPVSPGYRSDWNVRFPVALRQEGRQYQVDGLVEAKQGGYYQVVGEIRVCDCP